MQHIELTMTVIGTDGRVTKQPVNCPLDDNDHPDFACLRGLISFHLGNAEPEHVYVFSGGEYLDMFVDETGSLDGLPVNPQATEIYWNNTKVHRPEEYDPTTMPRIHGTAVMFDKKVWF